MSEKSCGEIIKQTRRRGDAETRRTQIPRKISFTRSSPPPCSTEGGDYRNPSDIDKLLELEGSPEGTDDCILLPLILPRRS
ncbi:MAG: hypothetical protein F6K58_24945 [Symploca sp. SIO2E9]|nr:hypothetical protein [Symploca sp. SIO2E9]